MRGDGRLDRRHDLTWERLVAAEPTLASLLEEVRAAASSQIGLLEPELAGQFRPGVRAPTRGHKPVAEQRLSAPNSRRFGASKVSSWESAIWDDPRAARPDDGDEYELEGIWGQFKDRIASLVGWHRRQGEPLLQTEAAYKTTYNTLVNALHADHE
jgi:hypothetical protein